ncbi:MAG: glycerol-3-phosphate 1-O-acyltransferase [Xanthomonadales bacterium]|nr:glycerol-3-phosphate 1-O-acyltransferase [Gammaproteobacteria bacterium]MBT8052931.1 glycerol-3-phosphate 1-O-acyltransferase [Gammaproteobacteria bacterium]NND57823.1 glycerol-3-phosphate 1-O-acyltransferase [Xanthomonadales bacterium]NNK50702.1 glycerol-3-phosphate 1-O-acyltransferase [Xanthomonadales bacterium]
MLFILDVRNRLEKNLLEECLDQFIVDTPDNSAIDRILLPISKDERSPPLDELIRKLDAPGATLLVPVRVAWLMPETESTTKKPLALRHLVLGDPRHPGSWRGRWIRFRDPSRTECIMAQPATIDELKSRYLAQLGEQVNDSTSEFAGFVARQAGLSLEIAEWGLIGRRYKAPRFVAESLTSSPKFKAALADLAAATGRPLGDLHDEAEVYMKELIAVPSSLFIDFRARFDSWVMRLSYEGNVVFREDDLERVRKIVQYHPSMLLFTHKTYVDSIALTATLFENDFRMLHIFAGINMSFAGLGFLMRRSGGIFIRRKFQDNLLYKIVLRHYIGYLMEKRFPMTWAFEGTRSRTGKLMPPRYGLLKYVLEAAYTTDARDIHVIPVTVSYDLMRDVQDYASEQAGKLKKPESLKWFISYLSSLRKPMGRIYLDFGQSVVLPRAPDPEDQLALPKIAFEVAVQANNVTPITMPAVACMVLLGAAPRALTIEEIQKEILAIVTWAHARSIRLTSDFSPRRLAHVEELAVAMQGMGLLIRYDEGTDTVFGIETSQHLMASYYRNTIIHHFVNKAILELALLRASEAPVEDVTDVFWQETLRLRDFFKFEFFYPSKKKFKKQLWDELERSDPQWEDRLQQGGSEVLSMLSAMLPLVAHSTLLPFIEAYSVVFDLLARLPGDAGLAEEECMARALKVGKQAYLQRRITSEASIGKLLFQNGYKLADNLELTQSGGENLAERRIQILRDFKELSRRLERIRWMALSGHGE